MMIGNSPYNVCIRW